LVSSGRISLMKQRSRPTRTFSGVDGVAGGGHHWRWQLQIRAVAVMVSR
jgi:hypothetical protein